MARVFIDGFESGEHDMWDDESNATVVSSVGFGMDGDYCLDLNSATEYLQKDITADDEMYFAFLYRTTNDASGKAMLTLFKDSTCLVQIRRNSTSKKVEVTRGVTVIDTGTHSLAINTTYLIEVHVKIADAGGAIDIKIDGVSDITFSGDTKVGTDTQFNSVILGYVSSPYALPFCYFDNFIMDDAAWIGNTNIQAVVPTGAGNTTGWTPSAGANYECVDEIPPSDADYNSTNAVDITDTYAAGNMVGTIDSVKCVQVQARLVTDGAPTPTNVKLAVRSGATDYLSADNAVPASAKSFSNIWENNPADSAAWAEADVNAMEIGVKSAT